MTRSQVNGLLLCALGGACDEASEPSPGPAARAIGDSTVEGRCDVSVCGGLAGPCQVGVCDERTGSCQLRWAREGELCLEGNACGTSLCRAGECVALEPPPCAASAPDPCQVTVCRPSRGGCVTEPSVSPGQSCAASVPLEPIGTSRAYASNTCGDRVRGLPGCTDSLAGPSALFSLDLTQADRPTPVDLVIDADFAFEAALGQGACGDGRLEHCGRPVYADGRSRRIYAILAPGHYQLVVTGKSDDDRGGVRVAIALGDPSCEGPPPHDSCANALRLDPELPSQLIIDTATCARVDEPTRCPLMAGPDVFYELDLSLRASDVLLEVDVITLDGPSMTAGLFPAESLACGATAMCGAAFARRLRPGSYRVGVSQEPDYADPGLDRTVRREVVDAPIMPSRFALRLRTIDAPCAAPNDTWQAALELDPSLERQPIVGSTACAEDDVRGVCNDDRGAPDVFYRLDLRGATAPREVRLTGSRDFDLLAYILTPDESGVPTRESGCEDRPVDWFTLAPKLYYMVIDGRIQNAGRFDLELRQSEAYAVPFNCFDSDASGCLRDSEPACNESFATLECLQVAVACGLAPDVHAAFCASFAGCCDGTAERVFCENAWAENLACN